MYAGFYDLSASRRRRSALGDVTITRKTIPDGDAGARATVREMATLIERGATQPMVRRQAVAIAARVAERDYAGQIRGIRAYVASHVRFLRDPDGIEQLHDPELMVLSILENTLIHVDCDDVAILAGALGKSIGLLARIVTVAFPDPAHGDPFAHTWAELSSPVGVPHWIEMDTTRSAQSIDPSFITRTFIVDV